MEEGRKRIKGVSVGAMKILIVGDSATKRALYRGVLEKEDYEIVEARDGEDGLNKSETESPDIIIADLAMPKMEGFKMVETIKKSEKGRLIPTMCVSAICGDMTSKIKILIEDGAEEFFCMHDDMNELVIKVQVMVRIRKLYLELLEKNRQLQIFNKAAMDRELRMVELKDRIRSLEEDLERCKKATPKA